MLDNKTKDVPTRCSIIINHLSYFLQCDDFCKSALFSSKIPRWSIHIRLYYVERQVLGRHPFFDACVANQIWSASKLWLELQRIMSAK